MRLTNTIKMIIIRNNSNEMEKGETNENQQEKNGAFNGEGEDEYSMI